MPKIEGTEWYTAAAFKVTRIEGSERHEIGTLYGYRRSLAGLPKEEIAAQKKQLEESGIIAKERVSKNNHTGIPAGTPFLEVLDVDSVHRLEAKLAKMGVRLPANRFDVYKQAAIRSKQKGY